MRIRRPKRRPPTPETIEPGHYIRNGYERKIYEVTHVNRIWAGDSLIGATVVTNHGVYCAAKFCRRAQRIWPDVDRWRRRRTR
jgi:hypothetical protein